MACLFGVILEPERDKRKISIFVAVAVAVVTVGLFLSTACLCFYAFVVLKIPPGINLYLPVLMSMRETFNLRPSDSIRMRGIEVNSETLSHWNKTQMTLKCCGFNGYTDWTRIEQDVVPDSCCRIHKSGCGKKFSVEDIYHRGCEEKITKHVKQQYIIQTQIEQIFYWVLSIIVFLPSGIMMAYFSVKRFMRNKNSENGYDSVSDDVWSDDAVKKRVTFIDDSRDKFIVEIVINRKA